MPNFTTAFNEEVILLARKEIRSEVTRQKKQSAQYRHDIATLKRKVDEQAREIDFLKRQEKQRLSQEQQVTHGEHARFSAQWLKRHRKRLGLSAEDYGRLVGVSGASIYSWENEQSTPRSAQKAKLATVRGVGKREAVKRLEMMDG